MAPQMLEQPRQRQRPVPADEVFGIDGDHRRALAVLEKRQRIVDRARGRAARGFQATATWAPSVVRPLACGTSNTGLPETNSISSEKRYPAEVLAAGISASRTQRSA